MTNITIERNDDTFFVPAHQIQAAMCARSKDETRYYLKGVYLTNDNDGRLVATDGSIMLLIDTPESHIGTDIILDIDTMNKAFKAKVHHTLWVYGDTNTGIAQFIDWEGESDVEVRRVGVCEFDVIDGTFPDYTRVLPEIDADNLAGAITIAPALITRLMKAGKIIGDGQAMRFRSMGGGNPIDVAFSQADAMRGVIMPIRFNGAL